MKRSSRSTDKQAKEDVNMEEEQAETSEVAAEDELDDDSDDSSSSEEPVIEYLASNRSRRANAGNKMSTLIESTAQEDDFYKSAYGGFNEDEVDEVFNSPVHSDEDEVDSDFDRPEVEDEPVSDQEGDEKRPRRKKAFKEPVRGSREELLAKNRTWAVARMGGNTVAPNSVDARTQAQRLKEAEETERVNVESLRKYEQFELERKKKREKSSAARRVPPPYVSSKSTAETTCLVVPALKNFVRPKAQFSRVCAITGRPAKYRDPVTSLPFASTYAFKVIRDQYHKHLKTVKDNEDVKQYMAQFE